MALMRETHIDSVNLNLVPLLAALIEEQHVTRAAERVRLSQPAMSRALQQLRRTFGDELLIRGPDGYLLTPRAERIREQLATTVVHLEKLFAGETFDPGSAARMFRIAASDYTLSAFGPDLVQSLLAQSPNSTLNCVRVDEHVLENLDAGTLDLLIFGRTPPGRYRSQFLFDDRFVCVVAADHPSAGQPSMSVAQYQQWPHVNTRLGTAFDNRPETQDIDRCIVVSMPNQVIAAKILPGTELVLTVPERLVPYLSNSDQLCVIAAPPELGRLEYFLVWHGRNDDDPAQRWLRKQVEYAVSGADVCADRE